MANYDLCKKCISEEETNGFYMLHNEVDEDVKHEYISCNQCKITPIWGPRFQCLSCLDFDICEGCYDKNLEGAAFHEVEHEYRIWEQPVFGNGYPIHEKKCFSCYQNPILGPMYSCFSCKNYQLCNYILIKVRSASSSVIRTN